MLPNFSEATCTVTERREASQSQSDVRIFVFLKLADVMCPIQKRK